jgi:hypothetical protein
LTLAVLTLLNVFERRLDGAREGQSRQGPKGALIDSAPAASSDRHASRRAPALRYRQHALPPDWCPSPMTPVPSDGSARVFAWAVLCLSLALGGCATRPAKPAPASGIGSGPITARTGASGCDRADQSHRASDAAAGWVRCAVSAHGALAATSQAIGKQASALATHCTDRLLESALRQRSRRWSEGPTQIDGTTLTVEFRQLSPALRGPLTMVRAQDVPMQMFGGERFARPGLGVPLALVTTALRGCARVPFVAAGRRVPLGDGVDRTGVEDSAPPRLVIGDPVAIGSLTQGTWHYPLAEDTSAFFAYGAGTSKLPRLAIWGLLGGHEVGTPSRPLPAGGLRPLQASDRDDPRTGQQSIDWARLSNAIWGDPLLRSQFQVWHVVYQTNAPLLVIRHRVKGYLDEGWRVLDPEGDDPARNGMVLIGHSLGGVVSRLLSVDSGEVLWSVGFTEPVSSLKGDPGDLRSIDEVFHFTAYPGISRAIFMASPHRGSPTAGSFIGRFMRVLVGRRAPELEALNRVARDNPEAVTDLMRPIFTRSRLNSIATLQPLQPVRRAGETLMPGPGIPYHTIAGVKPGSRPESDGVVPLASAIIPGAQSTLVISSEHNVQENPKPSPKCCASCARTSASAARKALEAGGPRPAALAP